MIARVKWEVCSRPCNLGGVETQPHYCTKGTKTC